MKNFFLSIFYPKFFSEIAIENRAEIIISYQTSLFSAIGLSAYLLGSANYFQLFPSILILVGLSTFTWSMVYIYRKRKSFIPSLIIVLHGAFAAQFALYVIENKSVVVAIVFALVDALYAFIILNFTWGVIIALFHAIMVGVYISTHHPLYNEAVEENNLLSTIINLTYCFLITIYLFWVRNKVDKEKTVKLNESQKLMTLQYDIISKQNEEKTVMLKEIHHRVKNNLQIITSLLRLQARELESPEAISKFKDATNRVIAISMVHERMYQSDELSSLSLKEYLTELSKDLLHSYQSDYDITMKIECDIETIGLKAIVPVALIINELISNSLKYAFDNNDDCWISIKFSQHKDTYCKITYSDSGTWKTPSRTGTFGMDLIESLTYQMEGTLKYETYPDTIFEIIFTPQDE
jgi:two-component sensor histidine kinase